MEGVSLWTVCRFELLGMIGVLGRILEGDHYVREMGGGTMAMRNAIGGGYHVGDVYDVRVQDSRDGDVSASGVTNRSDPCYIDTPE